MSNFDLAKSLRHHHLVVQPSDLALDPPESYLLVQDGLIVVCGVLYTMCYLFYMTRTYKDKHLAGSVEYLCGTMAYELYYAFATTSTRFELGAFLIWFLFDASFALVAIFSAYPRAERRAALLRVLLGVAVGIAVLRFLAATYPDEREQTTAYWTGILLQFPIGWGSVYLLLRDGSTRGHSLEIWTTRYLGTLTAYAVFFWRYLNIPQNWAYVASPWSVGIIVLTLLPETVYPFIYVWVHAKQGEWERGKRKVKGA